MESNPLVRKIYYAYVGFLMTISSRWPLGTNIYDKNWDILVILDTCRVDAIEAVANEYDFLSQADRGSIWSVGSASLEWMVHTFTQKHISEVRNTAYISGNGFTQRVFEEGERPDDGRGWSFTNWCTVDSEAFEVLDQPFLYADYNENWATPPRAITERGIATHRDIDPQRLILHYAQPHHPYAANARKEDRTQLEDYEESPFEQLQNGHDIEPIWDAYLDELREVLDEVEIVLNNTDAETVAITSDHGEAFGEWGFLYGHPIGILHPVVRKVPWVETTATDRKTFQPTLTSSNSVSDVEERTNEQLKHLGYLN